MIKTPIIPVKPDIYNINTENRLDYKAICCFMSTGFFLQDDTYYVDQKVRKAATVYQNNEDIKGKTYFEWHYSPRKITLEQAVDEFSDLFDRITKEQTDGKRVILPLSGGIDSRSQAAALIGHENVQTYSYKFEYSFDETKFGRAIARSMNWDFNEYVVPEGYLWKVVDELSLLNGCYSEFTSPRQMSIKDEFPSMGDVFYIGHWGDVLFDNMGLDENLTLNEQVDILLKKVVKKGGLEIASTLWKVWGLSGDFESYLRERFSQLLSDIHIDNANARMRAFKSLHWAPRWTSVNLSIFSKYHPLALPYYDNRLCEWICTVPEKHLACRQIQIEYIKRKSPALALIPWQNFDPCNLYNYQNYKSLANRTYTFLNKLTRKLNEFALGRVCTERNWEIQFLGKENDSNLRKYLFDNKLFYEFIPQTIVRDLYNRFSKGNYQQKIWYSHPISMLLTLSQFIKQKK